MAFNITALNLNPHQHQTTTAPKLPSTYSWIHAFLELAGLQKLWNQLLAVATKRQSISDKYFVCCFS